MGSPWFMLMAMYTLAQLWVGCWLLFRDPRERTGVFLVGCCFWLILMKIAGGR